MSIFLYMRMCVSNWVLLFIDAPDWVFCRCYFTVRNIACVVDFVTPLKKRRLARESLESPFPFHSVAAAVATGDSHEGNSPNTSETDKGNCEASTRQAPLPTRQVPLPTQRHLPSTATFRDGPDISSADNLFEVGFLCHTYV